MQQALPERQRPRLIKLGGRLNRPRVAVAGRRAHHIVISDRCVDIRAGTERNFDRAFSGSPVAEIRFAANSLGGRCISVKEKRRVRAAGVIHEPQDVIQIQIRITERAVGLR